MNPPLGLRRRLLVVATVVTLLAACSSDSSEDTDPSTNEPANSPAPVPSATTGTDDVAGSADFCDDATAFVTATDVRLVTAPDADVFADIDARLASLVDAAPAELAEDLGSLRTGYQAIDEAYSTVRYDRSATVSLPGDVLTANRIAAGRLERFLVARCDLDGVRDRQIADIATAFGIEDQAIAECLHAQLGDIANIESSDLTPELMITPVCETSLLGLLSGEGETRD